MQQENLKLNKINVIADVPEYHFFGNNLQKLSTTRPKEAACAD